MKRLALCVCLLAFGCGDDDGAADSSVPDAGSDSAAEDSGPDEGVSVDASAGDTSTVDTGTDDAGTDDAGDDAGPMDAGDDTSLVDTGPRPLCFHNRDCETDERCEDLSGMDMPHCEVGERGAGGFGASCTSENDCGSGLCVENFCSDICAGTPPLIECAAPLPRCLPVFGLEIDICFPPRS